MRVLISTLWIRRKGDEYDEAPELVEAWSEFGIDNWPEGWDEAKQKALDSISRWSRSWSPSDDTGGNAYLSWLLPLVADMRRVAPVVLVTPGLRNAWQYPDPTWALCWAKPGSPRRSDLGGFNEWEPVLMYGKRRIYNDFRRLPAWNNTSNDTGDHPCPKPIRLMRWLVEVGSDAGALVVDPFMGSGTTLRAAKDLGRRAIGIELEERYCEIAARRMGQEVLDFGEAA